MESGLNVGVSPNIELPLLSQKSNVSGRSSFLIKAKSAVVQGLNGLIKDTHCLITITAVDNPFFLGCQLI